MSRQKKRRNSALWWFLFVLYCIVMLWLLFDRPSDMTDSLPYRELLARNTNLIPFYTIGNYWRVIYHRTNESLLLHCFVNLLGNVLLFIPAGWLIPRLWKYQRNFFRFFLTCTAAILLVETLQLFTLLGSFDVDDLILNLSGMVIGFLGYQCFSKPDQ